MSDRSSAPDRDAVHDDDALRDDDAWEPEPEPDDDALPRRRRRRLVTPVTAALSGLLIATAGFIAGVQVQKGQQGGGGTGSGANAAAVAGAGGGARAAGFGGGRRAGAAAGGGGGTGAAGAGQGGQQPTFGSVSSKKGSTLYVQNSDGTMVRVRTDAQSKVTRNAAASPRGIYPGDTVVVQGTKDKDGSVIATQITATAASAAGSGGGGFARAFGGQAAPGAAPGG